MDQKYFYESLLDLNHMVQFLLFFDCQKEDILSITILERFSLLNKITPGLKLSYYNGVKMKFVELEFNEK